ncbi:DUF6445 family protein [Streptosporangium sp. NBC_01639]|uniref:DUF6445 family protein n=1 Tax=Streptosporangium sp. NBC_01639 TaxID=2975948 RepID=UPI003866E42F|nr:DUF6445 family protein [Streptosporangium sp. NBC_01639]
MRSMLIIVDDFYPKPDVVRRGALKSDYANISSTDYPGWQSRVSLQADAIKRAFSDLIGADIYVDSSRFTWGGFRFITEESGRSIKVHADTSIDWAAMVYLTPDADMGAGTAFFRHRKTGLEGPPTDREARALGYVDAAEFEDKVIRPDMADLSKWEMTGHVGPAYNRLILFRGCAFYHAPLGGSGDDKESARLTHNFFFNEIPHEDRPVRPVVAE